MKRIVLTATSLAVCALLPAAAPAQKNKKQPGNLTIQAASTIKFGRSVTISGKLTGPNNDNKSIVLREDPFPFDGLVNVNPPASTNAQGEYAFTRSPTVNTLYQTRQGGLDSQVATVQVSPVVSLRLSDSTPVAGRRVRFSGTVCPEHDGAGLKIQRRIAPKRFRTVAGTTLADAPGKTCSTYSKRVRVRRDGTYRALIPDSVDLDHVAGASRARRIDVHG
jgi:hypothetical protein